MSRQRGGAGGGAGSSRVFPAGRTNEWLTIEGFSLCSAVGAEPLSPVAKAPFFEPGGRPVAAVRRHERFQVPPGVLHRSARVGGEEAEGDGTEAELEQPAPARGLEVVVPFGRRL